MNLLRGAPSEEGTSSSQIRGKLPLSDTLWSSRAKEKLLESKQTKIPSLQFENMPVRFHFLCLVPPFLLFPPKHTLPIF